MLVENWLFFSIKIKGQDEENTWYKRMTQQRTRWGREMNKDHAIMAFWLIMFAVKTNGALTLSIKLSNDESNYRRKLLLYWQLSHMCNCAYYTIILKDILMISNKVVWNTKFNKGPSIKDVRTKSRTIDNPLPPVRKMSALAQPPLSERTHHKFRNYEEFFSKNCGRPHLKNLPSPLVRKISALGKPPDCERLLWTVFPLKFWCVSVCPKNQRFWHA